MPDVQEAIRTLIDEADHYLARFKGDGIDAVRAGIAKFGHEAVNDTVTASEPACGHLDGALFVVNGADSLRAAIGAARPHLGWKTYDSYPPELIGGRFPVAHAFATLIGNGGFLASDDFELGLFLIAPKTFYRDHRHKAPELYAPLTGPHEWRFGPDAPWEEKPAHEPVWNDPMRIHATLVRDIPFLALYAWTQDINEAAMLVPAADWQAIEESL
jgi:hypothetical protein